jgi:hypothetical protein
MVARPDAAAHARRPRVSGRTALPRTGPDIDQLVAPGLAATAGGAAPVLWSAHAEPESTVSPKAADPNRPGPERLPG